jgi:hypothetical protein
MSAALDVAKMKIVAKINSAIQQNSCAKAVSKMKIVRAV